MPERVDFWGIPNTWGSPAIYVYTLMFLAAIILAVRFYLRARLWWRVGRREANWDNLHVRIGRLIKYAIVQTKVLGQRYPGVMHVAMAWAFFVFFLGTGLATIDSHFYKILVGTPYLLHKLVMDSFTVVFVIGAGMAVYRRFIQRPRRLTLSSGFTWSLILVILIVLGGLLTESLRLAVEKPAWAWWSPVGWLMAKIWISTGASDSTLTAWHLGAWIAHLLIVAATLITLPVGTLLHILTGPINVFFSKLDQPTGRLAPIPTNAKGEPIYASTLRGLTWKQLLEGDACTECGRCQEACPAFAAGKPLNPKQVILAVREALRQDGMSLLVKDKEPAILVGEKIKDEELWSCTTCGACVRECPVLIEHVDAIVDMRRYLVNDGRVDAELQDALSNLGRYGNSFGQSERMRAKWTQSIQPPIKDVRKEAVEYLWFVGDYASYHSALTNITLKTAQVFQKAGVNFGILYDGERNSGNDVRRVGEEGLFELLTEKNIATMAKCEYRAIITTDPHSYNTLKNEYSANGNHQQVLHYTELLDQLITAGKLQLNKRQGIKVTYHDPCYLGRYNGVYDAPRRVIEATGCELVEMPRHRERTFCCGAGGGRIWMEEKSDNKERPAEIRVREAADLPGVSTLVTACPKDLVMFRDAVKTAGLEGKIIVKDLIELVGETLESNEVTG
jgi:Fe-S oxidoreductase